jgi:hypothetical protein
MKQLISFLLLLPVLSFAQDCKIKKEKDQFSQEPKVTTGFMKLSTSKGAPVSVSIEADAKEIKLLFSLGESQCFDDQSTASVSWDSTRSKTSLRNATAMNCDGIFSVVFRNSTATPAGLEKFSKQKVSSIILINNRKEKVEITLNEDQKQLLRKFTGCLIPEAKALIKPAS